MTCATCHGRGVYDAYVTTFSLNPGEHVRNMKLEDNGKQLVPCPDCTPKPFAVVKEYPRSPLGEHGELLVGGAAVASWDSLSAQNSHDRGELLRMAYAINAAVEVREAKLREGLLDALIPIISAHTLGETSEAFALDVRDAFLETFPGEGVPGSVACALAFDLGAMQAKVEGTWSVLADALFERGGESSDLAFALADRLGLKIRTRFGMK